AIRALSPADLNLPAEESGADAQRALLPHEPGLPKLQAISSPVFLTSALPGKSALTAPIGEVFDFGAAIRPILLAAPPAFQSPSFFMDEPSLHRISMATPPNPASPVVLPSYSEDKNSGADPGDQPSSPALLDMLFATEAARVQDDWLVPRGQSAE